MDIRMYHKKIQVVNTVIADIHLTAVEKGWWEKDRNDGECIALMHSELSEALEALRHGNPMDKHCLGFDSLTVELADCIIRIFDYAGFKGLRLAEAIITKAEFNKTRPHKHGKEF